MLLAYLFPILLANDRITKFWTWVVFFNHEYLPIFFKKNEQVTEPWSRILYSLDIDA